MADKSSFVVFPTSAKRQRHRLNHSPTRRMRGFTRARAISGWALVLGSFLFLATNFTLWSSDSLSQIWSQLQTATSGSGIAASNTITYPSGSATDFVAYDNGMAVVDTDTLYILQSGGLTRMSAQLSYITPTLQANDRVVCAYDRGGTALSFSNGIALTAQVTTTSPIVSANLGDTGGVAVITDETGYKSAVTVYAEDGSQRFKWSTSDYYLSHAAISPDGSALCAVGYEQQDTTLNCYLFYFDLSRSDMQQQVHLGDSVAFALEYFDNGTVAVICDNGAFYSNAQGNLITVSEHSADQLLYFDLDGDGMLLGMRASVANERADIAVYNASGTQTASFAITQEPQSIVLAGDDIAVLTASGVTLYHTQGTVLWQDDTAVGAQQLCTTSRGEIWAIFDKQAVYVNG